MRLAASVFFAVALVAAVTVMTREPETWKAPSKQTVGETAASVQTARVAAGTGTGSGALKIEHFGRDAAGPMLRMIASGTAMPSMGTAP